LPFSTQESLLLLVIVLLARQKRVLRSLLPFMLSLWKNMLCGDGSLHLYFVVIFLNGEKLKPLAVGFFCYLNHPIWLIKRIL
jgi:hypothetical protein